MKNHVGSSGPWRVRCATEKSFHWGGGGGGSRVRARARGETLSSDVPHAAFAIQPLLFGSLVLSEKHPRTLNQAPMSILSTQNLPTSQAAARSSCELLKSLSKVHAGTDGERTMPDPPRPLQEHSKMI